LDLTPIDGLKNRRQKACSIWPKWLAGAMLATSFILAAAPVATAETRTLKLYYTHTRERTEITFKKNGRYIQGGLNQLNQFLRDWRRNEPTKMDPRLFDLVWETYRIAGGRDYIHVVSAYRSPETNSMLRKRSSGVAEKSQHMLGKAMDFYVPGVKLSTLRAAALKVQGGGVGYYPKSGSPFVHLDVGNVRHWPRMNRSELLALFPDGKTIHVPTDGKPLPGYKQALASYNARKKNGGSIQMASAPGGGNFLSRLFGGGADDAEDSSEIAVASVPGRQPAAAVAEAAPPAGVEETPETILAALPARSVPKPIFAPRPEVVVGAGAELAAADPFDTGSPVAPSAAPAEVALNIPLPTRRPDHVPAADTATVLVAGSAVEKASGATESGATAIAEILGEGRKVAAAGPFPGARPDWQSQVAAYAAIPEPKAALAEAPQQVALAAKGATLATKGGRVMAGTNPATPRLAMLTRAEGTHPSLALGTGVRTTEKSARVSLRNPKPEPKPVVIPVQGQIAEWALQSEHVAQLQSATEPARAHDAIRTAPSAVYTQGFIQSQQTADAHRFSGNAVTFLSIAKFATN
jgi:uncharacterized protein YcbK (DUF882 family)